MNSSAEWNITFKNLLLETTVIDLEIVVMFQCLMTTYCAHDYNIYCNNIHWPLVSKNINSQTKYKMCDSQVNY